MDIPDATALTERLGALPAAAPLLERLRDEPGVYLVGGAVRDLLLGKAPIDLDLVVETGAARIATLLGGNAREYDRFGTATVAVGAFTYDIARARRERYAYPGALPDVAPATLEEDLHRRDFTVNAMAIGLTGQAAGRLTAVPAALTDLDARRLRVLHDGSFIDDPTRLLRLVRYAARLRFAVEPATAALARSAIDGRALDTVSGTRIGTELRLLAAEPDPVRAFVALSERRLDRAIVSGFGIDDPKLARRALALSPEDLRRDRIVLALACRGVGAGAAALLDRLAFDAADRDAIVEGAVDAERLARALEVAGKPSEIVAAVGGLRPETVALAGALGPERQAREWLALLRHVELEIDGNDLVRAGVPQGPAIGAGLRAARAGKLDGRVAGREAELAEALRVATAKG